MLRTFHSSWPVLTRVPAASRMPRWTRSARSELLRTSRFVLSSRSLVRSSALTGDQSCAEAHLLGLEGQVLERGDARVGRRQLPQDPDGAGGPAPGEDAEDAVPPVPGLLVRPDEPGDQRRAACLVGPVAGKEFPELAELVCR